MSPSRTKAYRAKYERARRAAMSKWDRAEYLARKRREYANNHLHYLFLTVRSRAKLRGVKFTIAESDLVVPSRCPITRHKFGPACTPYAPSLDRINNHKGYVPGNVRIITRRANVWKSNMTVATVRRLLAYMEGKI